MSSTSLIFSGNGGPDLEQAFLNEQIAPTHPEYARLCQQFSKTPQGQRIIRYHKQNAQIHDDLPSKTMAQLDQIIAREDVIYPGERDDRVGKIMCIRAARITAEKDKLAAMTPAERKAYLSDEETAPASTVPSDAEQRRAQDERRAAQKSAFEQHKLKKLQERERNREANNKFLEDELRRSSGTINPMAARRIAEEKRKQEEAEAAGLTLTEDADQVNPVSPLPADPKNAPQTPPGEAGSPDLGRNSPGDSDGAPEGNAGDFDPLTQDNRREELLSMDRNSLRELTLQLGIPAQATWSNEQRIAAILEKEFSQE